MRRKMPWIIYTSGGANWKKRRAAGDSHLSCRTLKDEFRVL
jgi:hypothetical protein